jgi:hypothetical protein
VAARGDENVCLACVIGAAAIRVLGFAMRDIDALLNLTTLGFWAKTVSVCHDYFDASKN